MFGSPLRQGYHDTSRHGPLLLADTAERDQLLPPTDHLPGTPQRATAVRKGSVTTRRESVVDSGRSKQRHDNNDDDDDGDVFDGGDGDGDAERRGSRATTPKFRIGSKRFDELLAVAVKQVEKQERRVQQSRPRQSPHTPDPFVVRPFADGEDDGSDSESLSTSVRSTSRDSRPALPRHMAPARYMSDTALLAQSSKGDGGLAESHASGPVPGAPDTPTPAHPDAEEEGRGRPPPVVAWNAPDESIVTSPSSVSVASPRRILVQALAEEQQPDVIPAPTPFRPTGMPRTRAVPRPAYDLRQAWGGSDDDDQQHQDQQQDQQQDQHVPTRVERQRLLVTASKTRGEYRLMQSDSRDDDDDDDDDEDEVRRGVAGVTVGAPMPSIWEEDEDEGDETETEDMTAHVEVDYAQDAAHAYAHPQYIITDDSTPLQIAAAHGQTERVAELLAQGVDVNEEDGHGRTAVMYSVHCNHIDTTRLLISQGADLDHRAQDGATALHRAAYCGTRAMVMLLLESGSDHRIPDEEGRLPLHWSAHNPNVKCLSALIKKVEHNMINHIDNAGMSALLWAAYYDRPLHLRKLLRNGADINVADIDGKRAVHWATCQGSMQCLRLLLDMESSMLQDNIGRTVAHYAAELGNKKALKAVLRLRAGSAGDTDANGRTPLHYAAVCMQPKAVKVLIKHGADIDVQDAQGWVPLDYAVQKQSAECAALLAAAQSGRPLTIPEQQAQVALAVPETPADATMPGDAVQMLFELLASGTYLLKFTNGGKGATHHRFFWIDMLTGEVCWAKSPEAFYKNPKSVEGRPLTSVIGHPSVAVRSRPDYEPETTHRFAFIINTAGRRLDVIAPSEAIMRLWVEGVRCLAAYQDTLLHAVQHRHSQDLSTLQEQFGQHTVAADTADHAS